MRKNSDFEKRKSGLPHIESMPWGSHFCHFYETKKDMLDILTPYFKAGLENNEYCLWVTSKPLTVQDAKKSLKKAVPNLEQHLKKGQIDIVNAVKCKTGGKKSCSNVFSGVDRAIYRGFEGLRLACGVICGNSGANAFYCHGAKDIAGQNAVCAYAYPRDKFKGAKFTETLKNHRFAFVRNAGKWDVIESRDARLVRDAHQRNKEKLSSVFANISEGFAHHRIVLDDRGKPCDYIFIETNKAFEKLTGLKQENIAGKRVTEVLPGIENDPTNWIGVYGKVALSGKAVKFENYSEGIKKWYSVSAFSPQKGYFSVIISDITDRMFAKDKLQLVNEELTSMNEELTASNEELRVETDERKKAEETLLASEYRLNQAQKIAGLGSWELELKTNKLTWSDEVYRILGLTPHELNATYEGFLGCVHPEDRAAVDAAYSGSLRKNLDSYEIEHRIVRKDTGEARIVLEKCVHLRDTAGKTVRSIGMIHDITERRHAEAEIIHMASFPKNNPNPVIEIDADRKVTYANQAVFGMLKELGASRTDLFFPADIDIILDTLRAEKKDKYIREVGIKDRVFLETISIIPELKTVRIYAQDITKRKFAEEKSQKQAAELETIFASLTDAVIVYDADAAAVRANSAATGMFGYDPVGKQLSQNILSGAKYEVHSTATMRALRGENVAGVMFNYTDKSGVLRTAVASSSTIRNIKNVITGAVTVFQDITGLKKNEEVLKKMNLTLTAHNNSTHAMMRAVNEGEYIKEVCGIIMKDCGYAMVWVGFKEENAAKSVRPMAQAGFEEGYLDTLNITWADTGRGRGPSGTAVRTGETCMCRNILTDPKFLPWREQAVKRGYASSIALPLSDNSGVFGALTIYSKLPDPFGEDEVKLLEALANDLAYGIMTIRLREENKQAGEIMQRDNELLERLVALRSKELITAHVELERAKRLSDIGTLAATVAHELRNPLAAIGIAAYNIKRKANNPDLEKHLSNIQKKISESDQIINNLLSFSRIKPPVYNSVDLHEIIEESMEAAAEKHGPHVAAVRNIDVLKGLVIEADPVQIKEVINNILNNACDAVPKDGGRIEIKGIDTGVSIGIVISDNGHGIDNKCISKVFDPFFTTKAKGTGLGLSVCRQIVDFHGGSITIESEAGKGTAVAVCLPKRKGK